ncbi:unnamed protein product [Hapterophycus canaliculatus]
MQKGSPKRSRRTVFADDHRVQQKPRVHRQRIGEFQVGVKRGKPQRPTRPPCVVRAT